jgi:hypothetical protein
MAVLGPGWHNTVIGDVAAAFAGSSLRPTRRKALQPGGGDPTSTYDNDLERLTV